jgi:DNA-binding NtrC family response regulator
VSADAMKALTDYSWPGNVRELENAIERLVVTVQGTTIELESLSSEIRVHENVALRRSASDDVPWRKISIGEWSNSANRSGRRSIHCSSIGKSPEGTCARSCAKGSKKLAAITKIVARLFNMEPRDYKRFLNFLRKHNCQLPFKEYR